MTMSPDELAVFQDYLNKASHYLEFGSGQSTLRASQTRNIVHIDAVESSEDYLKQHLLPHEDIQKALTDQRLTFHLIDIGETKAWGQPKSDSHRHLWPNYSLAVFTQKSQHDLVLIDGRFRVACALSSILNLQPQCPIIIHDFWGRPEYYILLKFLKKLEQIDTLGVFQAKENLNRHEIQRLLQIYQYHPNDKPKNLKVTLKKKEAP